jgi:2-amino-4-hydroxy-6-hydroxymethyldihydropteridine diphosphokinase
MRRLMRAQSARGGVIVALGANEDGPRGNPGETLEWAFGAMEKAGLRVLARSPVYASAAVGPSRGLQYANAVVEVATPRAPAAVLRVLKRLEAQAGRRASGRPWGPRALDLDLVDWHGSVRNWRGGRPLHARAGAKPLVLPHPLMHLRPFVLRPLLDVAPDWRHPVLRRTAAELWRSASRLKSGRIL